MNTTTDIDTQKNALRETQRELRNEISAKEQAVAAIRIVRHFILSGALTHGDMVAGYWPLKGEFDVRPLMGVLESSGFHCALPCISEATEPLLFRRYVHGDALKIHTRYKVKEPEDTAEQVEPTLIFVPLLAFDAQGYRLGYGGGYYDRTLEALRAGDKEVLAVGIGYESQKVDSVPHADHDQPLDMIVTERGVFEPGKSE